MKTTEELKNLLYKNETVADAVPDAIAAAQDFCEGYKTFLDNAKTEREATAYSEKLLTAAGYQKFVPGTSYAPGTKVYTINREKCVLAATIGTKNLEEGFHLNIAHIDSPRLDLRPVPVFEKTGIGYLRTHYYGGVRKYQWPTIPLALHGVIYRADGTRVNVCIGEKDDDPVFCITDLLPHLGAKQSAKTLAEGITAEDLNVIIASLPIEDKDAEQRVKLNVLGMLNEAYGITERDFTRAEIEVVPAYKARDIGLDRAMIGAYGHDDRVDAYPALMAEIGTKSPAYTSVCVLTDKEETGSDGVTGLNSMYTFHFLQQLCAGQGADYITACKAAKCLSADVTAAYDPTFADAFEPDNGTYAGRGVAIYKYTGSRGKSGTSDASAELVSYLTGLMDANSVVWQIGEMGKLDLGGGGTVAKYVANQDIDTWQATASSRARASSSWRWKAARSTWATRWKSSHSATAPALTPRPKRWQSWPPHGDSNRGRRRGGAKRPAHAPAGRISDAPVGVVSQRGALRRPRLAGSRRRSVLRYANLRDRGKIGRRSAPQRRGFPAADRPTEPTAP